MTDQAPREPRRKTEGQRRRNNKMRRVRGMAWYKHYRQRIAAGEEHCRRCGTVSTELVFGHIVANINGGTMSRANIVILCPDCDRAEGDETITDLPSLADEDLAAGTRPDQPMRGIGL